MYRFFYTLRNLPALLRSWLLILGSTIGGMLGAVSFVGKTSVRILRANGQVIDLGMVSARKVTKVGVTYLCNAWKNADSTLGAFKYAGCGTGVNAESNTDTTLQTECTAILNPASTRATCAMSVTGTDNNVLNAIGTLTFQGAGAITEHGLLSQAATGGGTLFDRSVFAAINVASGDSIQFTYQLTVNYEA
jgi:hypothetical protein